MKAKFLLCGLMSLALIGSASISYATGTKAPKETSSQFLQSSTITADIKAKLLADPDVKSLHISVKTVKDSVTLTGFVITEAQKKKAVKIANEVKGVKHVNDELIIKKVKALKK